MRSILLTLAFTLNVSSAALAQPPGAPETQAREILKQARAVIWDETKSKPLQRFRSMPAVVLREVIVDGQPIEEVTVKKVKINPPLKSNKFERQALVEEPIKMKKRKG